MHVIKPESRGFSWAIAAVPLFLAITSIVVAVTVNTVRKTDDHLNDLVNATILKGRGGRNV